MIVCECQRCEVARCTDSWSSAWKPTDLELNVNMTVWVGELELSESKWWIPRNVPWWLRLRWLSEIRERLDINWSRLPAWKGSSPTWPYYSRVQGRWTRLVTWLLVITEDDDSAGTVQRRHTQLPHEVVKMLLRRSQTARWRWRGSHVTYHHVTGASDVTPARRCPG